MIVSDELEEREETEQDHTEIDDRSIHNDELDEDDDNEDNDEDNEQIDYLEVLKSVFTSVAIQGFSNYVVSGQLKADYGVLPPAITISGCTDRLAYPLCAAQAQQLITTRTGQTHGEFQFNAETVTILPAFLKNRLPLIITEACAGLGVSVNVEARFRALMLCSKDSQYEKVKNTARDGRMFGSLLIQLPSMYEGGTLFVEHDGDSKTINFSGARSGDDCYFTSFFCGCEISMKKITSGVRLLLVFDLLVGAGVSVSAVPRPLLRQTLETAIRGAVAAWQRDVDGPAKLVWNTENGPHGKHVYTLLRSIFATKGQDHRHRQPILRCFQVDLEKEATGNTEAGAWEDRCNGRYEEPESVEDEMGDVETETVNAPDDWFIDEDDDDEAQHPAILQPPISLDTLETETLGFDIFSDDPDNVEYESYEGTFTATYSSNVLVFWPADTDPNDDGLLRAVKRLERQHAAAISEQALAKVMKRFDQILDSITIETVKNPAGMFATLLRLCTRMDIVEESVVKRVVEMFPSAVLTRELIDALILALVKYGYSLLSTAMGRLFDNVRTPDTVALAFDLAAMVESKLSKQPFSSSAQTRLGIDNLEEQEPLRFDALESTTDSILIVGSSTHSSTEDEERNIESERLDGIVDALGCAVHAAFVVVDNNSTSICGPTNVTTLTPVQKAKLVVMAIRFMLKYARKYDHREIFRNERIGNLFFIQPGVVSDDLIAVVKEVVDDGYFDIYMGAFKNMVLNTPASDIHFAVKVTFCLILSIDPISYLEYLNRYP